MSSNMFVIFFSRHLQLGTIPTFGDLSMTTRLFIRAMYWAVGLTAIVLIVFGVAGAFT